MDADKHPYVGTLVEWSKSGRAKGEKAVGKALKYVPAGVTNKEAIEELREERRDLTILNSYCKVGWEIEDSSRLIVAVVEGADPENYDYTELPPDDCIFYAPNKLKVRPA
jgi:hypothetical protein